MQHAFPDAISDIHAWRSHQASRRIHGSTLRKVGRLATKVSRRLCVDVCSISKSKSWGFVSPERSTGRKNAAFQSWAAREGPSV